MLLFFFSVRFADSLMNSILYIVYFLPITDFACILGIQWVAQLLLDSVKDSGYRGC